MRKYLYISAGVLIGAALSIAAVAPAATAAPQPFVTHYTPAPSPSDKTLFGSGGGTVTSGSGTITSIATNNGLTGGTITTTGTIGLDTTNLTATNGLVTWGGSNLVSTSTFTQYAGGTGGSGTALFTITPNQTYGSSNVTQNEGALNIVNNTNTGEGLQVSSNNAAPVAPLAVYLYSNSNETQPVMLVKSNSTQAAATTLQLEQSNYVELGFKDDSQNTAVGAGKFQLGDRNNAMRFESRNYANNSFDVAGLFSRVADGFQMIWGGTGNEFAIPNQYAAEFNIVQATSTGVQGTLFDISATSSPSSSQGNIFQISATSTVQATGATAITLPDNGIRVSIASSTYQGNPQGGTNTTAIRDQLLVDGRINTEGWDQAFCDKMGNTGGSSAASNLCGNFAFAPATAGTYKSVNVTAGGYAYDAIAQAVTNAAGDGSVFSFGNTSGGNGWMSPATTTPVMEVNARINQPSNATSSIFYIGFTSNAVTTPVVTLPTDGCWFTASSTQPNWYAISSSGSTQTEINTGVASSSGGSAGALGGFYRFRLEVDNGRCDFFIQQTEAGAMNEVAHITTNIPTTKGLNPELMITQVTNPAGANFELDFNRFRVWWRDVLPVL